jgi:hypothetical protein
MEHKMAHLNDIAVDSMYDHKQIAFTIQGEDFSLIQMGGNYEIMSFTDNEPRYLARIEDLFEYFADKVSEGDLKYEVTRR